MHLAGSGPPRTNTHESSIYHKLKAYRSSWFPTNKAFRAAVLGNQLEDIDLSMRSGSLFVSRMSAMKYIKQGIEQGHLIKDNIHFLIGRVHRFWSSEKKQELDGTLARRQGDHARVRLSNLGSSQFLYVIESALRNDAASSFVWEM